MVEEIPEDEIKGKDKRKIKSLANEKGKATNEDKKDKKKKRISNPERATKNDLAKLDERPERVNKVSAKKDKAKKDKSESKVKKPPFSEIFENIDLDEVNNIVDIGCGAPNTAYQFHRRYECRVYILPVNKKGVFDKESPQRAQKYIERLVSRGMHADDIEVLTSDKNLPLCDVLLSIGTFGDDYDVIYAKHWIDKMITLQSRIVMRVREGSGGYKFLNKYGNNNTVEKTKDENDRTVNMVITSIEPSQAESNSLQWKEVMEPFINDGGFFTEDDKHSFSFIRRSDTLIVTFDNLDIAMNNRSDRRPWGFGYIKDMGWSMLGVMANGWTWYRDPWVISEFNRLRDEGFFDQFERVVFYGASMGGYAALAFSAAVPGSDVVVFAPQTILDKSIVPWETRYKVAWDLDFSNGYGDAAETIKTAGNVYVFYDPYAELDNLHAERLQGKNVHHYRAPLMGHKVGTSFLKMDILQPIVNAALSGRLTHSLYRTEFAARKKFRRYLKDVVILARDKNHDVLALRACDHTIREVGEDPFFMNHRRELHKKLGII